MFYKDVIIIALIALIIGLAVIYIYKAKKSGKKCIGCPDGCSGKDREECKSCKFHNK